MIVSKLPKALILLVVLALAGTVVVAGCGGGSSSTESTAEEAAPPAEEKEEAGGEEESEEGAAGGAEKEEESEEGGAEAGGGAMSAQGKAIFATNCSSCHTLKAAGATGTVGPNLDELMPDEETVEKQVITGGGPMPAFGNKEILTPEEIETVSAYVASEAGK
jgi:mono/diheme cytochrome c family protein